MMYDIWSWRDLQILYETSFFYIKKVITNVKF